MIVKVDLKHKGKTESLIFGHAKGGKDWKEHLGIYLLNNFVRNKSQEAKLVLPEILKIEQAEGNTAKDFLWCRPSAWTRITKEPYPRFGEATSRTESGIKKAWEGAQSGKAPTKSISKTSKKTTGAKRSKGTSSSVPKSGSDSKKSKVQKG